MTWILAGRRVVVPETRELDVLADMLERQGATAIRCPLVSIHDTPDEAPVVAWLHQFIEQPADDLILMTGEGLQRLMGFARRAGIEEPFLLALGKVRKITRGPKPVRRLRELGLQTDLAAEPPTSQGIIAALEREDLVGRRIAVQLYPEGESSGLMDFLNQKGANADPVLCYVYGSQTEDARVVEIEPGPVDRMARGLVVGSRRVDGAVGRRRARGEEGGEHREKQERAHGSLYEYSQCSVRAQPLLRRFRGWTWTC